MLRFIKRYFHTISNLKFHQIYFRLFFNLIKPSIKLKTHPPISLTDEIWEHPFDKKNILSNSSFTFLNETFLFDEIGWDSKKTSKLWLYNLHYFDYVIDNSDKSIDYITWINDWILHNPIGSIGWDSYPTSLRIVNWIKFSLSKKNPSNNIFDNLFTQSLWLSKRIERHIEGNHLFANGKALIFAGVFFNSSKKNKFKTLGLKIIKAELQKQILKDGGHFELSPMYHAIILEDILDIIQLGSIFPDSLDDEFLRSLRKIAQKMILWLSAMSHPDDSLSFFNDSVNNISRSLSEIKKYALFLDISLENNYECLIQLKESGYYVYDSDDYKIIIDLADIGPSFQPGHGHADALSFEASIKKRKFIVNLGISGYQGSDLRAKERGTDAHSTIMIDSYNSSDVWGEFRVGKRAFIFDREIKSKKDHIVISGSHNGYKDLKGKPIHKRQFCLYKSKFEITDKIHGAHNHHVMALFHIHPDVKIAYINASEIGLLHHGLIIRFYSNALKNIVIRDSFYSPEFGIKIPSKSILIEDNISLPCEIKSFFAW